MQRAAHARGLHINDVALLRQALTHKSLAPDAPLMSNERLEFLGDAVLGLIVAELLFIAYPERSEGELAKARAKIVCKSALAAAAARMDLAPLLRISRAEETRGGRNQSGIVADAVEALAAVVYRESGYAAAREFVLRALKTEIDAVGTTADWRDAKTTLQEYRQARHLSVPIYALAEESGAPHDRTFRIEVVLDGVVVSDGIGKSKKQAEQAAAVSALQLVRA